MQITATRPRSFAAALAIVALAALAAASPASAAVTVILGESAAERIAELGLEVPVVGRAFFIVAREDAGGEVEEPRLGIGVTGNPLWASTCANSRPGTRCASKTARRACAATRWSG